MPRISATKAGLAQVRPYVREEVVRQTWLEEARLARPDLATTGEELERVGGAYRAVHNALKGALQEFVAAAAVGRRLTGAAGRLTRGLTSTLSPAKPPRA